MKLRILQVVSYYPPAYSFGGPPQVMFDLGKELTKRGHSVSVYTTDVANTEDWKKRMGEKTGETDGIQVRRFRRPDCASKLPTKFLKLMATGVDERCAREMGDFDVVHIAEITSPLSIRCSRWAAKKNVPYVVSVFGNLSARDSAGMRLLRAFFDSLWGRKMLRDAAALLVQTRHEGERCAEYTSADKIALVPLPINTALFQDLPAPGTFRKRHSIPEDKRIVLFLGRLHKSKGINFLVQAFAELANGQGDSYRLVIAGADDGYRGDIVQQVRAAGIESKVVFTGPIFGRHKLEAYADAAVFATTPLIYEETSLAALEACACGTPVIVTERNSIPDLQTYQSGFEVNGNSQELTDRLRQILEDEGLRRKMSENASRLIRERHALEKVADSLESLLVKIAQARTS